MKAIVRWSLSFRLLVLGLAAAVIVLGVAQLRDARLDVLPEYSPPYVEIQTEALGLSAAEVEQFVTVPMEALMLSGVAWVETIRSESVPGLSSIVLVFEPDTDVMRARQMVQERLNQAHALPNVSKPPQMIQPLSSSSRVMIVSLASTSMSTTDLSVLARWTVRPRLMGVPGVANVAIWGQREKQLQVLVDPERLEGRNVTLDEIIRTTGNALWVSPLSYLQSSTPGAGGFIDTPNQRLGIRHVLPIRSPDELGQVPVEGHPTVRLGDVTTVVEDHQPMIGDARTEQGDSLLLIIEKLPGESAVHVTRDVEEALAAMQVGLPGVIVDSSVYRPATFVETAIANLSLTLLLALVLVAAVLAAFLVHLRAVVIALISLILSAVTAALVLHAFGTTVNTLVVAGLAIAGVLLVDDAVADVEGALARLRAQRGGTAPSTAELIVASVGEVRGSVVYATAITFLVLIPILAVDGVTGLFLQPFAIAFATAVLASFVVGLTVTPVLAVLLLRPPRSGATMPRPLRVLGDTYDRALTRALGRPGPVLLAVGLAAVIGVAAVPQLSSTLAPTFRERDLLIHVQGAPGTSQPAIDRIADQASAELRSVPGVRRVGGHVGRAIMADQVVNINSGQLWLSVEPSADYDATLSAVRNVLAGYPGLRLEVDSYLSDQAESVGGLPEEPVSVRVFGPDLGELEAQAENVRLAVAGVPGVVGARVLATPLEPLIEVKVDLDAAYRFGVKPGDVRRAAATLINGLEVGNLFEEQKVFEVIVVGVGETRHSLNSVQALRIDTPSGRQVALSQLADVRIVPSPVSISRAGISRYIDVVADVEGRDIGAVQADVQAALGGIDFPIEYHPELSTAHVDAQAAFQRHLGVVIAVVIGIFLVLQAATGSWRLAGLVLLLLPASLVGGIVAVLLGGGQLSLGATIGLLGVLAIATRNHLALLARLRTLERDRPPNGPDAIAAAARDRLVPTFATAIATALAFLPFLVLGDQPGLELLRPMALVVIGGLVTSTLVSLFVLPSLYVRIRSSRQPEDSELHLQQAHPAGAV